MFHNVATVVLLLSSWATAQDIKSLETVLEWKSLDFGFPTDADRQNAINMGIYKPNSGTPIDVDVEYKPNGERRVFHTIPRFGAGMPYSLATVSKQNGSGEPILEAYPSYDWHNQNSSDCLGIVSALRVKIDDCNRMWVIDSGVDQGVQRCPPQLLTFDLTTDTLFNRYQFASELYTPGGSHFISVAVDVVDPPPVGNCSNVKAYVADVKRFGLVVYDLESNVACRIEDKLMLPNPQWGNHTIAGTTFELLDGIFAINTSPRSPPDAVQPKERYLFFHALAEETECAVPLRFLNIAHPPPTDFSYIWQRLEPSAFEVIGRRGVQSAMEAMDSKGNLFASTNDPLSIFVWNIETPYEEKSFRVVANDPEQLEFVSGMKVVKNPSGDEELWVSTSRFQRIIANTLDYGEVNFVVSMCNTDLLLEYGKWSGGSNSMNKTLGDQPVIDEAVDEEEDDDDDE